MNVCAKFYDNLCNSCRRDTPSAWFMCPSETTIGPGLSERALMLPFMVIVHHYYTSTEGACSEISLTKL